MDRPRPAPERPPGQRRMAAADRRRLDRNLAARRPGTRGTERVAARPATTVFVNHPGSVTHHDIVAACVRLQRAGFAPVPHVVGAPTRELNPGARFSQRAAGEAAVKSVLLIAGDPAARGRRLFATARPAGDRSRRDPRHRRRSLLPPIPRGIRASTDMHLETRLRAKIAFAGRLGLDVSIVTQFVFDAARSSAGCGSLRDDGFACTIRVGVAGPATIATLAKFAVRCGIGASLRALGRGQTAFARILDRNHPRCADRGAGRGCRPRRTGRRPAPLHVWRRAPDRRMDARAGRPHPTIGRRLGD